MKFLASILTCAALALPACNNSTVSTDLSAAEATVSKLANGAITDAESPAGKAIIGAVESGALNIGLDAATGNDTGAIIAGGEAVAGVLESYSGLPTASSAGTLTQVAQAGAGVAAVAQNVVPSVVSLIQTAQKTGLSQSTILQAVANGLYAVRAATATPATTATAMAKIHLSYRVAFTVLTKPSN